MPGLRKSIKMIVRKSLLVFLCLSWLNTTLVQAQTADVDDKPLLLFQETDVTFTSSPILASTSLLGLYPTSSPSAPRYLSALTFRQTALSQQQQPSCYSTADLAFFCRLEVKLERATKIPVRFRLGDVQQVDYLEGKFTAWRYGY